MKADAGEVGKLAGAPGALDVLSNVNGGPEMLRTKGSVLIIDNSVMDQRVIINTTHHIQSIRATELPLASIAVIRRMLLVSVSLKSFLARENKRAIIAAVPVSFLLMFQTLFPIVGRPSSETPTAFNLIAVRVAGIQVVTNGLVGVKCTAAALMHDGLGQEYRKTADLSGTFFYR